MTWATTLLLAAAIAPQVDEELAPYAPEIFGEPEKVAIDVRVVTANGEIAPKDLRLVAVFADAPQDAFSFGNWIAEREPYGRGERGWPEIESLELPTGRPVAVVAFSPSHGVAERILDPDQVEELAAEDAAPLELVLPAPRELAAIRIDAVADPGRWPLRMGYEIRVRAPVSDLVLAHEPLGHRGGPIDLMLPAGDYVLTLESFVPDMCGNGQPLIRPTAGLRERLTVQAGESRTLQRYLDVGAALVLRVDVRNCAQNVAANVDDAKAWLTFVQPTHVTVGEHFWTATATIERIDVPSLEEPMWFGWDRALYPIEKVHFPLGLPVYGTRRYMPGTYRLTVRGPRIETTVHTFRIERSDVPWPRPRRNPLHVLVEARA